MFHSTFLGICPPTACPGNYATCMPTKAGPMCKCQKGYMKQIDYKGATLNCYRKFIMRVFKSALPQVFFSRDLLKTLTKSIGKTSTMEPWFQ